MDNNTTNGTEGTHEPIDAPDDLNNDGTVDAGEAAIAPLLERPVDGNGVPVVTQGHVHALRDQLAAADWFGDNNDAAYVVRRCVDYLEDAIKGEGKTTATGLAFGNVVANVYNAITNFHKNGNAAGAVAWVK